MLSFQPPRLGLLRSAMTRYKRTHELLRGVALVARARAARETGEPRSAPRRTAPSSRFFFGWAAAREGYCFNVHRRAVEHPVPTTWSKAYLALRSSRSSRLVALLPDRLACMSPADERSRLHVIRSAAGSRVRRTITTRCANAAPCDSCDRRDASLFLCQTRVARRLYKRLVLLKLERSLGSARLLLDAVCMRIVSTRGCRLFDSENRGCSPS